MEQTTGYSPSVVFREGALGDLGGILESLSAQRILFVVDSAAYEACGAAVQLADTFGSRRITYFTEFELNPKLRDVERGIELLESFRPDVVMALGGGTAIDLAKMIRGLALQQVELVDLITGIAAPAPNGIPLVVIPTTAGTGSEATHFAVVYRNGEKYSVAHQSLAPEYALLDPELTYSMPAAVTAATGLDALCQAVESMWAVGATDESVDYASRALRLVLTNLESVVQAPTADARRAMCEAAHLAGKAINISKTTAPHAVSYWLTSHYGIAHGVAVAVFLGAMLEYNAGVTAVDCNDPRGALHVQRRIAALLELLEVSDAASGRYKLEGLITAIDCPASLQEIGIVEDSKIAELAHRANPERLTNNPRRLDIAQLITVLNGLTNSRTIGPSNESHLSEAGVR
jgi:alcohol dehydrogenase class IV